MTRRRHGHEKILQVLREAGSGSNVTDLCERHGISRSTFYRWQRVYGGLTEGSLDDPSLTAEEHRRIKSLLSEAMESLRSVREATSADKDRRRARFRRTVRPSPSSRDEV
jgi:putative transposase